MSIIVDIEKKLGDFHLKVNFEGKEEILALLGASGSGKTVTLKCIAGIEKPDRGRILVNGKTLFDSEKRINISPQKRKVGLLYQNYALFPNMTVKQNILTGTRRSRKEKGISAEETEKKAEEMIQRFGLSPVKNLYPGQISGGQQQRTALARLLISEPEILLLDEPFSALDSHLRFQMEEEVGKILEEFGKTTILVSHDRDEVFRMSDKLAVMNQGKIEVAGKKEEVFKNPVTVNGARITGCKNISPAHILDKGRILALDWGIELETDADSTDVHFVGIRLHDVQLNGKENVLNCQVVREIENPFTYILMLQAEGCSKDLPFGMEIDKSVWEQKRSKNLTVGIPKKSVLLLR